MQFFIDILHVLGLGDFSVHTFRIEIHVIMVRELLKSSNVRILGNFCCKFGWCSFFSSEEQLLARSVYIATKEVVSGCNSDLREKWGLFFLS